MEADHGQLYLLSPNIGDWVEGDHPVCFIQKFVAEMGLISLGLRTENRW